MITITCTKNPKKVKMGSIDVQSNINSNLFSLSRQDLTADNLGQNILGQDPLPPSINVVTCLFLLLGVFGLHVRTLPGRKRQIQQHWWRGGRGFFFWLQVCPIINGQGCLKEFWKKNLKRGAYKDAILVTLFCFTSKDHPGFVSHLLKEIVQWMNDHCYECKWNFQNTN